MGSNLLPDKVSATISGSTNLTSVVFMGKFLDDLFMFFSDDLFKFFARMFQLLNMLGVDASALWMIVLGIVAVVGVYWVAQQFLE